jgi:hypothetical protein
MACVVVDIVSCFWRLWVIVLEMLYHVFLYHLMKYLYLLLSLEPFPFISVLTFHSSIED